MSVIGYYVTCDDAVCTDCAPDGFADGDYAEWAGFESWEEPIAIMSDEESDSPTHCRECEALIAITMTSDGYRYVAEHVTDAAQNDGGRRCITRQWWQEYGDGIEESDLREIISAMVATWPERDEYSPKHESS